MGTIQSVNRKKKKKKKGFCDLVDKQTWTTYLELEIQFSCYRVRLEETINIWWYVKRFGNWYLGSASGGLIIVLYFDRNINSRAILRMFGKWHCNKSLRTYIDSKRAGEFKSNLEERFKCRPQARLLKCRASGILPIFNQWLWLKRNSSREQAKWWDKNDPLLNILSRNFCAFITSQGLICELEIFTALTPQVSEKTSVRLTYSILSVILSGLLESFSSKQRALPENSSSARATLIYIH